MELDTGPLILSGLLVYLFCKTLGFKIIGSVRELRTTIAHSFYQVRKEQGAKIEEENNRIEEIENLIEEVEDKSDEFSRIMAEREAARARERQELEVKRARERQELEAKRARERRELRVERARARQKEERGMMQLWEGMDGSTRWAAEHYTQLLLEKGFPQDKAREYALQMATHTLR